MIHVIGDSHVSLFSGKDEVVPVYPGMSADWLPQFRTYRLGAVLAYNLREKGHTSQGKERLDQCLTHIDKGSQIMLVFGEIDVRTQLLKQVAIQKKSLATIVERCVNRYFVVIATLAKKYDVLVWNTPPQSMSNHSSNKFPTVGTGQERNAAARLFNSVLQERCAKQNIPFISIFDKIVSEDNVTDMTYLWDTAHLNQKALPFVLEAMGEYL